ncbi:hypothetical protein ACFV0D_35910, partial [Streptomyces sp. NPDC059556]|uniref:hypothetical protein n=1 Tax=Streptomyces sp. NPDC059556 TaxID=3346863 RepID=UPI00367543A3
ARGAAAPAPAGAGRDGAARRGPGRGRGAFGDLRRHGQEGQQAVTIADVVTRVGRPAVIEPSTAGRS